VVGKGVKRATAPTKTCGEWEVQTKTTEKENPEEVGWIFELCGVRYGGEGIQFQACITQELNQSVPNLNELS